MGFVLIACRRARSTARWAINQTSDEPVGHAEGQPEHRQKVLLRLISALCAIAKVSFGDSTELSEPFQATLSRSRFQNCAAPVDVRIAAAGNGYCGSVLRMPSVGAS